MVQNVHHRTIRECPNESYKDGERFRGEDIREEAEVPGFA